MFPHVLVDSQLVAMGKAVIAQDYPAQWAIIETLTNHSDEVEKYVSNLVMLMAGSPQDKLQECVYLLSFVEGFHESDKGLYVRFTDSEECMFKSGQEAFEHAAKKNPPEGEASEGKTSLYQTKS